MLVTRRDVSGLSAASEKKLRSVASSSARGSFLPSGALKNSRLSTRLCMPGAIRLGT
jgi:hypothetical protein